MFIMRSALITNRPLLLAILLNTNLIQMKRMKLTNLHKKLLKMSNIDALKKYVAENIENGGFLDGIRA